MDPFFSGQRIFVLEIDYHGVKPELGRVLEQLNYVFVCGTASCNQVCGNLLQRQLT